MSLRKDFRQSLLLTAVLLVVCGVAYPYALVGLGTLFVPEKVTGSLLSLDGQVVGSALVGQNFTDPRFMKGRPSAVNYNTYTLEEKADGSYGGVSSGSANMGNSNPALKERVEQDLAAFLAAHPTLEAKDIPTDLLTASGSGLDPHISPASALVQVPALVQHTALSKEQLEAIIAKNTIGKTGGIFGGQAVHVLGVNLDIARALKLSPGSSTAMTEE